MKPHKTWVAQYKAARSIRINFGFTAAFQYLVAEKFTNFAKQAEKDLEYAQELCRFRAAVHRLFDQKDLASGLKTLRPADRRQLRELL
jgi:hypothetical protein